MVQDEDVREFLIESNENLANLDRLPEAGAFLIAAPIKLEGGSGGPVRVFAILPPA